MGDMFSGGGISSESTLDDMQHDLIFPLRNFAQEQLGRTPEGLDQLMQQLLSSTSKQSTDLAQQTWKQGFLDPVMNSFNSSVLPSINSKFSGIGGTLSSRRTKDLGDAATNMFAQASGQFGQMLPSIMSFPLQQTLGQIQGLGALQQQRWSPFQNASQFALQGTRSVAQEPAGAGWGLVNSGLQLLGTGLGSGFLKGGK